MLLSESSNPYSLRRFFCLMARWRSCTLCSFDPVKYMSVAPYVSGLTMRRSIWMPPAYCGCVRMEDFVFPLTSVSATISRSKNACVTAVPSPGFVLTRMSISPMVSCPLRREPA